MNICIYSVDLLIVNQAVLLAAYTFFSQADMFAYCSGTKCSEIMFILPILRWLE